MNSISFCAVVALLSSDIVVAFGVPRPHTRAARTTTNLGAEPKATFGREPTDDWLTERTRRLFNPRHDPEEQFGDETRKQLINFKNDPGPKQMMNYIPEQNMKPNMSAGTGQPVARSEPMSTFGREPTDDWRTERTRRLFNPRHDPEKQFGDETQKQLINFKNDPGPKQMMNYKHEQGQPVTRNESMDTFERQPTGDWLAARTKRLFTPRHDPEEEFGCN